MTDEPRASEELLQRLENGVLWLTINRADRGNAIPYYVRDAMRTAFQDAQWNVEVRAIYGIEVPRTLPVNAEMPEKTRQAEEALKNAAAIARKFDVTIGQDVLQSRHLGQSLVDASGAHGCALVIIGVPYKLDLNGEFALGETADYLLKNAPSRVWVIRGQPGDVPATPERAKEQTVTR